ncbi:uncharacterized protein BDW43DRAFT_313124 [Aspergillus alliaceus]|uniref:uncharacterized protein n=1 Tax=Petromyces alliaceus TaxID=209559 RepID=UPI0012A6E811|nr:uncharacterized protein BDW43DRAFT_313124 [Aspergillus alliaceus]KAB8231311.1 hypothetical protein BDW43DRAFT_313124 [Aspergillus alliaceus]
MTPPADVSFEEDFIRQDILAKISCILFDLTGTSPAQITPATTLTELAVDSLTTIELRRRFNDVIQVSLPMGIDNGHYTLGDLAAVAQQPSEKVQTKGQRLNGLGVLDHSSPVSASSSSFINVSTQGLPCGSVTRLIRIVAQQLNISDSTTTETELRHLGLDSLVAIDLESDLCQAFGLDLNLMNQPPTFSISNLIDCILLSQGRRPWGASNQETSPPGALLETLSWFAYIRQNYRQFAPDVWLRGFQHHGALLPIVPHVSRHWKVVGHCHHILAEYGLIQQAEYGWAILNDFPAYRSEHQVLKCTGSRLADCFSAKADALQVLFRNEKSHELLEEPLSILELGAGTGGATKYVLEQLISHGIDFDYTLTDISSALGTWARQRFGHYKQLRFTDLDIEKSPPGEHVNSYDIIISSNCIHATKDLATSCRNIFSLLRPNGMLCLSELTRDIF